MARNHNDLTPRKGEHGVEVYGKRLNNRGRALLEQAFDLLHKGRKDDKGRDFVAALADAILESPLGALERIDKMTRDPEEKADSGKQLNINSLYLMAVQGAQTAAVAPRVIEHLEPLGTSGVQPTLSDW